MTCRFRSTDASTIATESNRILGLAPHNGVRSIRRNYKRRDWTRKEQIAAVSALSNQSSPHRTLTDLMDEVDGALVEDRAAKDPHTWC
jgi:hypothetical protein